MRAIPTVASAANPDAAMSHGLGVGSQGGAHPLEAIGSMAHSKSVIPYARTNHSTRPIVAHPSATHVDMTIVQRQSGMTPAYSASAGPQPADKGARHETDEPVKTPSTLALSTPLGPASIVVLFHTQGTRPDGARRAAAPFLAFVVFVLELARPAGT